jgi:small ligand-binding sensory domain FIST
MDGKSVSLGLIFMTPRFFPHAGQVLEILRVHARIPLLAGCSSNSLITGDQEIEESAGLVLGLFDLPGAQLQEFRIGPDPENETREPDDWHQLTGISRDTTNGWLAFADPFNMNTEGWLQNWNRAYAATPTFGGLASGNPTEPVTQIYVNDRVYEDGGVAISFGGSVGLAGVISQGCTPIGETWTITRVEGHLIREIGNRPAYEVLAETFQSLSASEQAKARGNLFAGLVMDEYRDEFRRGDFLIRNLLGADPQSGCIAVGAYPRAGQTIQFQRRDAAAANEDMIALLSRAGEEIERSDIYGGCLCCCNGRGRHLFGLPSHDAGLVQQHLGPMGLAGFFCNGEIGPVGSRNYLHGYTASLALFVNARTGKVPEP